MRYVSTGELRETNRRTRCYTLDPEDANVSFFIERGERVLVLDVHEPPHEWSTMDASEPIVKILFEGKVGWAWEHNLREGI